MRIKSWQPVCVLHDVDYVAREHLLYFKADIMASSLCCHSVSLDQLSTSCLRFKSSCSPFEQSRMLLRPISPYISSL